MKRLRDAWLALPEVARLAVVIVLVFALGMCAGCATFSEPRADFDLLTQDANSCAANPRALPACVIGFFIYIRGKF